MRKWLNGVILSAGVAAVWQSAWAQSTDDAQSLAQANGCLSCHAVSEKIVGPSFAKIAEKYAGQSDAIESSMQSVRNGSSGKWGRIPMPANSSLSNEDLKKVIEWVLTRKAD